MTHKLSTSRFWGKIFGLKCIYFIIECTWADAELVRKLSVISYSFRFGIGITNNYNLSRFICL